MVGAMVAPSLEPRHGLLLLATAAGLLWWARQASGRHTEMMRMCVAVALLLAALAGMRLNQLYGAPLVARGAQAAGGHVELTVVGDPQLGPFGSWRVDVRVETLDGRPSGLRAELVSDWPADPGTRLRGTVEVRPTNAGWLTARHVAALLTRPNLTVVTEADGVIAATTRLREALAGAASVALPPGPAGLATGLVTGDTRLLPDADAEAMRDTGLTHLTAVSGSNVALVATGAGMLVAVLGVGARGRRRTIVVSIVLFVVLTRADPSVLRASAMAGVVLLAQARGRRVAGLQALGAALVVLLLLDPLLARRLGLLLSTAATAGVLVVAPVIRRWFWARLGDRDGRMLTATLELLSITLGAQLAVLPVLLVIGEDVRIATVPANMVAVPAAAIATIFATFAAVVVSWAPGLAGLLLRAAEPPLRLVLAVAHGLRWWGPTVGPLVMAGALAGVAGWRYAVARGAVRRRISVGALAATVAAATVFGGLTSRVRDRDAFTFTAVDVGQGDAFLLRAGDAAVLIDAGRDASAATWLRSAGVDRLDLLVFTHADADHTGGGRAVLQAVDVGAVWQRPRAGDAPSTLAAVLDEAAAQGVAVHAPARGQHVTVGQLQLRVLGPLSATSNTGLDNEENESSLVLRVDGPGGSVLLTGDTGPAAHAALRQHPALLDVDVVTVPHHGSRHVDLDLVAATTPTVAVVSVGAGNGYGHPADEVLDAIADAGIPLRRTDREGTVHVRVGPAAPVAEAVFGARGTPIQIPGALLPRRSHARSVGRQRYGRSYATVHACDL
jgi:competence protein ComEC